MDTGLRAAIFERAKTITGIDADNVFYGKIPEKDADGNMIDFSTPCLAIQEITNPAGFRSTTAKFEDSYVQFTLWGKNLGALETLTKNLRTKFDDSEGNYTLTNYTVKQVRHQFSREIPGETEDVIGIVTQYKYLLEKLY